MARVLVLQVPRKTRGKQVEPRDRGFITSTVSDVARRHNMSRSTIYQDIHSGKLVAYRRGKTGRLRITLEDEKAWLMEQRARSDVDREAEARALEQALIEDRKTRKAKR